MRFCQRSGKVDVFRTEVQACPASEPSLLNALEYDLTQEDSDTSEQDEVGTQVEVRTRRLRLVWSQEARSQWHQEVRVAEGAIRELARRIGSVPFGQGCSTAEVVAVECACPVGCGRFFSVDSSRSTGLAQISSSISEPINFHENNLSAI